MTILPRADPGPGDPFYGGSGGRIAPYPARVIHEGFPVGCSHDHAGPGTPTAERRCSNHRQCGFESHPGYRASRPARSAGPFFPRPARPARGLSNRHPDGVLSEAAPPGAFEALSRPHFEAVRAAGRHPARRPGRRPCQETLRGTRSASGHPHTSGPGGAVPPQRRPGKRSRTPARRRGGPFSRTRGCRQFSAVFARLHAPPARPTRPPQRRYGFPDRRGFPPRHPPRKVLYRRTTQLEGQPAGLRCGRLRVARTAFLASQTGPTLLRAGEPRHLPQQASASGRPTG